ncbi:hypothetical protein ABT187_10945 [Streptomyces sp. NPDC001817]|uniref:hypothetical protein n=1 Tax=Streptomyces sp. NPDC001817 TaxID=3154398 RepID=UPI00331E5BB7
MRHRPSAATAEVYAEAVRARQNGRAKTGHGASRTVADLDEELRHRTPRIGLWPDASAWSPEEPVRAIRAGAQRAPVVRRPSW